ncbi:Sog2p [Sugiyamaella lignohabitans]|uniref:Sog2p n=1 Tax=Sugiyamaella lignohabitans TaxID=796027 RepID=A0A167DVB1_9ASCO|nr:Sog2p [Sugiyamaella lignohabitans]ANB13335.1 Sog2p [Sugiyamaella lignohabitans]
MTTTELAISSAQLLEIAQQELARGLENSAGGSDDIGAGTAIGSESLDTTPTKAPSVPIRRRGRRLSSSSGRGLLSPDTIGSVGSGSSGSVSINGSSNGTYLAGSGSASSSLPAVDSIYSNHNNSYEGDEAIDSSLVDEDLGYEEEDTEIMDDVEMQLTSLNIDMVPVELIELIKDKVTKLSLRENWIVALPSQFSLMSQLSYLDISRNRLTEFPAILCQCPRIEILDISGNQIRSLPSNIGNLSETLKVLSLSNNLFKYLPPCIAEIIDLQFLEVDNNPIELPPKDILEVRSPEEWITNIKNYLLKNRREIQSLIEEECEQYDIIGSDLDGEGSMKSNPTYLTSAQVPPMPLVSPDQPLFQQPYPSTNVHASSSNGDGGNTGYLSPLSPAKDLNNSHDQEIELSPGVSSPSNENSRVWSSERLRSNSESQVSTRAAKRMGFIIKKRHTPATTVTSMNDTKEKQNQGSSHLVPTTVATTSTSLPVSTHGSAKISAEEAIKSTISGNEPLPETTHVRAQSHDSVFELLRPPIVSNIAPVHPPQAAPAPGNLTSGHSSLNNPTNTLSAGITTPSGTGSRSRAGSTSQGSLSTSPVLADSAPGAYFRRLSTLPEEMRPLTNDHVHNQIMEVARKVLFSSHEFHDIVRRCSAFCSDKQLTLKLNSLLQNVRTTFPSLVLSLEASDQGEDFGGEEIDGTAKLKLAVIKCSESIRELCQFFRLNIEKLVTFIDIKFVRTMIMITFASFNELYNAWNLLNEPPSDVHVPSTVSTSESSNSTTADDQLYDRIYFAANAAQTVLGQLTEAISKSAAASVQGQGLGITPTVASKVKDLANSCVPGVEVTKRLKQRMDIMRETGKLDRKKFWDDTNAFLKAIIAILASTKTAMVDLPFLNDARQSLSTLARVAKEIPVLLEYSSYRVLLMSDQSHGNNSSAPSIISNGGSVNNPNAPMGSSFSPPLSTPLVAVLGPAAQAVMSPSYPPSGYASSPFIPQGN